MFWRVRDYREPSLTLYSILIPGLSFNCGYTGVKWSAYGRQTVLPSEVDMGIPYQYGRVDISEVPRSLVWPLVYGHT